MAPLFTNATGTAPVVVSYPPSGGQPHAYLFNAGLAPAYLGGPGVSSATGFPLYPNCRIDLSQSAGTIYAIGGFGQTAPYGTASAATTYPGGTVLTVASAGTAFTAGSVIVVEPGTPRQEIATVTASATTSVTAAAAFTFAHGSGSTFSVIKPQVTTLQVQDGAT